MPIVVLLLHALILSGLVALIFSRVLNVNEKVYQFKGGAGSAFCFGLTYTFLSYAVLVAIALSGYFGEEGLSTSQKWLLNLAWIGGSAVFINLYAYFRPNTLMVKDRIFTLLAGVILFSCLVLATLGVGFLL